MKTKKEIIQAIVEEIPYRLDESVKPYIEEAMEIYAKQQVKDNVVLPDVIKCDNIKKGETLILDNSLEVEVITPESMALVKDSRDETLTWVDKKRLKRK
jgi:hypothetical protein|tara:strand:- start:2145 stop:2441 length:297 start_codon:yes stop_codon:yes gene_type:complete